MQIKETRADKIFNTINISILMILLVVTIYPLWFVLCASISNPDLVNSGEMIFLPKDVSFDGYKNIFGDPRILKGYANSIFYTVAGTILNLFVTLPAAYALSRKDFVGNKFFTMMFLFTMFFSGGLIPTYMTVNNLGLRNTPWVMIILGATSMTNIILSRTFFYSNIPDEITEAAQIDGCSNFRLFLQVILPLSKPIIAVMALFFAVTHWNGYFTAMIYLSDKNLQPLQIILREILVQSEFNAQMLLVGSNDATALASELKVAEQIKYALVVVATLPVMCIYPFVQKHFVKGVMIGAVKG